MKSWNVVALKAELVKWTNARSLPAISSKAELESAYYYTAVGDIYPREENRDTDLQIGGIIDEK